MKAVKTITLSDWIDTTELRTVMDALGGDTLLVGGCVRNALLDTNATDIDIATKHKPETVMEKLEAASIKSVPTGIDHGTVTAVVNGLPFEITTLRKDVATDGRRATVAFSEDWLEDAERRDFTMNTLLMDLDGHVYDPTGQGLRDLEHGRVMFVGEAERRIEEDHLRILRFFRFHAFYGKGEMDRDALQACGKLANKIEDLSKERITQEALKLLNAKCAPDVLKIMFENRILPELFHVKHDLKVLEHYYSFDRINPIASLFVLSAFDSEHLETLEARMIFSNDQKKQFSAFDHGLQRLDKITEQSVKELIYFYKNDFALQIVQLFSAQNQLEISDEILDLVLNWIAPVFPTTGEDLIRAGYKPGPELGQKLKELEAEWVTSL